MASLVLHLALKISVHQCKSVAKKVFLRDPLSLLWFKILVFPSVS
jgi:hypothetical protein